MSVYEKFRIYDATTPEFMRLAEKQPMKPTSAILFLLLAVLTGCETTDFDLKGNLTDGFCIVSGEQVVFNHHDIDYYDYSTHLVYLKDNRTFDFESPTGGSFSIFADREEMYKVAIVPAYSSYMPSGPVVFTHPKFYNDFIIAIGFVQIYDTLGNFKPDPREDEKIVGALKKYGQFRMGLSMEIKSVSYQSANNVKVELQLKNNDNTNYYFLDPVKMGDGLFHYFTNGLTIRDIKGLKYYTHHIKSVQPQPWNGWESDWLSLIRGNETKTFTLTYTDFDAVPPGNFKATFQYPGLAYQVNKEDLDQENGRIWLGSADAVKDIVIR